MQFWSTHTPKVGAAEIIRLPHRHSKSLSGDDKKHNFAFQRASDEIIIKIHA